MTSTPGSRVNDPDVVRDEYEREERFLARRLTTWAQLEGPSVEDEAIALVAAASPARVVDVGCGTGDFTDRLRSETGAETFVLDLSSRMAMLARGRELPAMVGDIQRLPLRHAVCDCVLANRVLYHLSDADAGLAEVVRVLQRAGLLIAIVYGPGHLREVWELIGEASMGSATGSSDDVGVDDVALLGRHFSRVEERRLTGRAVFRERAAVVGYLQAFGGFAPKELAGRVGDVVLPFYATYEHVMLIGHKKSS